MMTTLSTKLATDLMVLSFSTVVGTGGDWDPRIVTFPCGRCGLALLCQDAQLLPRRHVPAHNPNNPLIIVVGPFNVILHALSHSDIDFIEIYRPFFSHVGTDPPLPVF